MQPRSRLAAFALASLSFTAPAVAQDLAGSWSGRMEPENLSALLELELRHGGAGWEASLSFRAGPDGGPLPVAELRAGAEGLFLRTAIEGAEVRLELALDEGLLLGSVRVTEGERVLAAGPAGLARAHDAAGQARLGRWLDAQAEPLAPELRSAVIEGALARMVSSYVFQERAEAAAADVRARRERGEYDGATTAARLAELLGRHLAEATGDRHVHVKHGAAPVADPLAERAETPAELAERRRAAAEDNFGIGDARLLEGNVGYLELRRFERAEFAGDALAAALARLAGSSAIVVDLRACRGGDPAMVVLAASWFLDGRPRRWSDTVRRCDGTTTQYWTAAWLPAPRFAGVPLYVLTAARTFSAPESFAYELQQMRRATIVGETTGGGAHSGSWFPLEGGFAIFVPLSRSVSATSGTDWEGTGVKPDVACPAAEALERARRAALAELGRAAGRR
jgi:hypothetical protein